MTSKVARLAAGILEAQGELSTSLTVQRATDLLLEGLNGGSKWTPGNQQVASDNSRLLSPTQRAQGRVSRWEAPNMDVTAAVRQVLEDAWHEANSKLAELVTDQWEDSVFRFAVENFDDRRELLESHSPGSLSIIPIIGRMTWTFSWQWPLRVAIVNGAHSAIWAEQVRQISERYWHLYSVEIVEADEITWDHLVIADAQHLNDVPPCSTLILVSDGQSDFEELATLAADRRDGTLLLSRISDLGWFGPMVIELSHDYPLDAAVTKVTDDVAVAGDPGTIGLTSVRAHGEWLGEQLSSMSSIPNDKVINLRTGRHWSASGSDQMLSRDEAGKYLREVAVQGRFDSELGSGSDVASVGEAVAGLSSKFGTQFHVHQVDLHMAAAGAESPEPEPTLADDRRLGIDFYLGPKKLERAVVADRDLDLLVSIGHGATVSVSEPIRVDFEGRPTRTLQVRVVLGSCDLVQPLTLAQDPRTTALVKFSIRVTGTNVSGFVIVYNEDQTEVIQAANLSAAVVTSVEQEAAASPSIHMSIVDAGAIATLSRPSRGTIVSDGAHTAATARDLNLRADSTSVHGEINTTVRAIKTAAGNFIANQIPINETLIATAKAGVRLRDDLGIAKLEPFDEIQMVSFTRNIPLPIEWVYGGEPPDDNASVCTEWSNVASRISPCPSCVALDATGQRAIVCASRFWGLSKVIEHTHSDQPLGSDYVARIQTAKRGMSVSVQGASLIGTSIEVINELATDPGAADVNVLLSGVINSAAKFGSTSVANNWSSWRDFIESDGPSLLIAMPHHGEVNRGARRDPALELGGMFESTFTQSHVRQDGSTPGPIVLLIGCDTGVEAEALSSFATRFRQWSPLVVATVGEIIAKEANLVVTAVLDALELAARSSDVTMGEVVTEARRQLLKNSRLSGLQLILHGDATSRIGD